MAKNFNAWPDQWPKSLNYPEQPVFCFLDQTAARGWPEFIGWAAIATALLLPQRE